MALICRQRIAESQAWHHLDDRYLVIDGYKRIAALESNAVVLSLYEAQMSALVILSQPRKRSVVQISESRPGHFASIRRLPD